MSKFLRTRACTKSATNNKTSNEKTNNKASSLRLNLLTTPQVAHYTRKSKSFYEKRRSPGSDGPDFLKIGASVYYRKEDVDAWLLARTCKPGEFNND